MKVKMKLKDLAALEKEISKLRGIIARMKEASKGTTYRLYEKKGDTWWCSWVFYDLKSAVDDFCERDGRRILIEKKPNEFAVIKAEGIYEGGDICESE